MKIDITDEINHKLIETELTKWFPNRNISQILLVNPPDSTAEMFRYDAAKRRRNSNYPPYGLLLLAQCLRSINIEVEVINLNHEVLKRCNESESIADFDHDKVWQACFNDKIREFSPDIIGVTCMYTMTHNSFKNVCQYASKSNIPLAIGGVHTSNDVERILKDIQCVAFAFLREADQSLPAFINVINKKTHIKELAQIVFYRDGDAIEITNQRMPDSNDINILPAWDMSDVRESSSYGIVGTFYYLKPKNTRMAPIISNRGCRAQCSFCGVRNFNGKGVRQRDISVVLDELQILKEEYGIGHVMWLDDDLLKDERRAIDLFNGMVKRNLDLTWDASNGVIAYSCTEEVVSAMAQSGCIAVNIGMETGNPEMLKKIRKPGKIENFLKAAEVFHKHDTIYANLLLMLGFPGETMRMVMDTVEIATKMDMDWYRISPLQPLPNTAIYQDMVNQGLIEDTGYEESEEVRFAVGVFGTLTEMEQGKRLSTLDFRETFQEINLDDVPTPQQITDIWFYMNYSLNFHRLFQENRPIKFIQQKAALSALANIISPNNAFALYFLVHLDLVQNKAPDQNILKRLEKCLEQSIFWQDRFKAFSLSIDDLNIKTNESKRDMNLFPTGYQNSNPSHANTVF